MAFQNTSPAKSQGPEALIPAGVYAARCYAIVDEGTQKGSAAFPSPKRKLRLTFEIPELKKVFKEEEGEKPRVIGKQFTMSFGDKSNLKPFLSSWFADGKPDGDLANWLNKDCLGKPAMLTISHEKSKNQTYDDGSPKVYQVIAAISPLPAKMDIEDPINPTVIFDLFEPKWDEFEKIQEWQQNLIKESPEYKNKKGETTTDEF